ncbi:MAG TPA: polysaccharide deacetylase family protein [Gemmataceae bacterium]|nr:polysaccharide deacetylase family protein [Gemmataceae bacterium]
MKNHLKATLGTLYKYSGFLPIQEIIYRWTCDPFLVVLLFHRVTDEIPEDSLTVSCTRFRALCHMLAKRFRVVPLGEIFRLIRMGRPLPPRTVAITFDDCYYDNLPAARVLAEYGLPATFFIPTAYVGTDHVFPWDRNLKPMPNLDWEDVAEMHRLGFEIGSHTVTHANLGAVTAEQADWEIVESKAILEDRLGSQVRWLAYPFGGVNNFCRDWLPLMKEAGYEGCVSAYGGFIYPGTDTDILPRQAATGFSSTLSLEVFLTGSLAWYYAFKRRMGLSVPWQTFVPQMECLDPRIPHGVR